MGISIILSMLVVGLLLGFVGAGGSGFIIAMLSTAFGFSIHTALGTSLAAMVFTTLSGAFSHYREGNVAVKPGIVIGITGAAGAWISSGYSAYVPAEHLMWMTAGMLFLSSLLLWIRMTMTSRASQNGGRPLRESGVRFWLASAAIGAVTGAMSGFFGIGSTPFIQIGMIILLGLSIRQAAGTTMLVIIPIALAGGAGYYQMGYLDIPLLIQVVVGSMIGSYIGAKFTSRVPLGVLKTAMIAMPSIGALLLMIRS
ncbi:sulfite exporter TauE/SafE family protein [Paenibacillus doosanensis]|uniref:Probable membrane transporter protein n=1 Tax=Paenibacillus konkukensis TaxID=2020716 RepID=A0ABY4RE40_9BACL|nr:MULTISPECIES: sulfite exporter TauE/SafE family protein [Paenibacillus]MCS7462305.1 sulfite exporter TauE/SafE family protein [Paenibacillus doosanensis]UQZ80883.1 Sulfite exporter TauE/SafE [Paenibacillus konkukensis]